MTRDRDELEALVSGAPPAQGTSHPLLSEAERAALGARLLAEAPPEPGAGRPESPEIGDPDLWFTVEVRRAVALLRGAIDRREKVRFDYTRADGEGSTRTVRPLALFFWGRTWTLAAWCELRVSYRSFRIDRMRALTATGERFSDEEGEPTLEGFLARGE